MTVLTGPQIRQARELLGWSSVTLARKARVDYAVLVRSQLPQNVEGVSPMLDAMLRRAFEAAGIEFGNGEEPRLRQRPDATLDGPAPYRSV